MIKEGTTLYRGVGKKFDEKELDRGIWSAFTSTSLDIDVANMYAGENGTIFEIKLYSDEPHPHVSISHLS